MAPNVHRLAVARQNSGEGHENETIFRTRTSFRAGRGRGKGVNANVGEDDLVAVHAASSDQCRMGIGVSTPGKEVEGAGASRLGAIEPDPANPLGDAVAIGRNTALD